MRIIRHCRDIPAEALGAVAALGNFDGVHLGHQALIGEAKRVAKSRNWPLAVIIFEPYPREFFRPEDEPFRLTPFPVKARILAELGVEFAIVLTFDAEMAAMPAQDFVLTILVEALHVSHLVIGGDFQFGKGRGGDSAVLSYMGEMEDFGVTVFAPVAAGDEKISSSDIRAALKAGRPDDAARLLGHWWSVEGEVIRGDQRGRLLGFPTANMKLDLQVLHPAFGVYAVQVQLPGEDGRRVMGVANFGVRPMFELQEPLLEVHLFDFAGDLYGKEITVAFIAYLRSEKSFADLDALKAGMAADAQAAREILAKAAQRFPALP